MYTLTGNGLGLDVNEGGDTILRNRLWARFSLFSVNVVQRYRKVGVHGVDVLL